MIRRIAILIAILFFLVIPKQTFAASSYVLPYPSTMPGSIWYKFHQLAEHIMPFWNFGDFGQFTYHLKQSDKYLVEGKTLFEYNQYLLGFAAIQKSNSYFKQAVDDLAFAHNNNKNVQEKQIILQNAAQKHTEVLETLLKTVPQTFIWNPEKGGKTVLPIENLIHTSISIRSQNI